MTGAVRMSPDGLVTTDVQSLFYENPADLQHQTSEAFNTDGSFQSFWSWLQSSSQDEGEAQHLFTLEHTVGSHFLLTAARDGTDPSSRAQNRSVLSWS